MTAEELATQIGAKGGDGTWSAKCPAHDDNNPSLSISEGDNGGIVVCCHRGCTTEAVVAGLGIAMTDLMPPKELNGHRIVARYPYRDEIGQLLYNVARHEPKSFHQEPASGAKGNGAMKGIRRVLYRLPEVLTAVELGNTVFITEGEKDADAIVAAGYCATTHAGGAGKWKTVADHAAVVLKDADVIIVRDNDEPGIAHAADVARHLHGVAASVIIAAPALGKDVAEHLGAGKTIDELLLIDDTTIDIDPPPPDEPIPDEPSDTDAPTLDELLNSQDEPYDWLIPGLIERGDRIILTGPEGGGKSTFLRQLGAQVAAGMHPFTNATFAPIRVLLIDLENSKRQVRRKLSRLRDAAGTGDLMRIRNRPEGIDLTIVEYVAWLERSIKRWKPDLLIIGPIYKMADGDPKDEQVAKSVSRILDDLRTRLDFAVVIEAHTPYADGGKTKRPERPYGASLWSRWPEFGMYLAKTGELRHWRGQRDEREWPTKLKRGDRWPWEVEIPFEKEADEEWHGPTHCMTDVLNFLTQSNQEYSGYALFNAMKALGLNYRRDTITQAAERLSMDGKVDVSNGARNARIYRIGGANGAQTLT